jgi:hypothetical protein
MAIQGMADLLVDTLKIDDTAAMLVACAADVRTGLAGRQSAIHHARGRSQDHVRLVTPGLTAGANTTRAFSAPSKALHKQIDNGQLIAVRSSALMDTRMC